MFVLDFGLSTITRDNNFVHGGQDIRRKDLTKLANTLIKMAYQGKIFKFFEPDYADV